MRRIATGGVKFDEDGKGRSINFIFHSVPYAATTLKAPPINYIIPY